MDVRLSFSWRTNTWSQSSVNDENACVIISSGGFKLYFTDLLEFNATKGMNRLRGKTWTKFSNLMCFMFM